MDYANLPISFQANVGQVDSEIQFLSYGQNGSLFLMRNGAWLTLKKNYGGKASHALGLKFAGGNAGAKLEALDQLPGKANYFCGNNSNRWFTNAATFGKIKYHDVYPGVDLVYYGNQQNLEYDLVVQPGANPDRIALEFSGAEKISLDGDGDLLLYTGADFVRQHKPIVYQEVAGSRKMLSGNYVLRPAMQVAFQVAAYDKSKPLIIDPVLTYSTTFGGSGLNQALAIAVDANDNVYVTGNTTAKDFSTDSPYQTNLLGSQDAFIVNFDTNGAVVYSTYLGGGLLNDVNTTASSGQGIAVDGNGNIFVTGYTTATNFPVTNAYQPNKRAASFSGRNAFVTELNPAGNALVYSTYLGGSNTDTATGIALDTNDDAVITGFTTSTNFPTVNAVQPVYGGNGDGFVAKLSADGSTLIYSTYLGGASYENEDLSTSGNAAPLGAVAVDVDGNAYVTGLTYSTNFPVLNAFQPTNATSYYGAYAAAFVTKLDPVGNLVYSTYFGGRQGDIGRAIGIDFNDNVYFAGNSFHGDLPTTNAFQSVFGGDGSGGIGDGFVAALDSTGTNLIYCTYLGGNGDDQINGIAVRPEDGAVAVTGFTDSPNFPLLDAIQPAGFQGLFKSTNAANVWNLSNTGLASGIIYSLLVDPATPSNVYALTQNGFYKSADSGTHWFSDGNGLGFVSPPYNAASGSLLAIDPLHPATLYVGAFAGIYKTTNGAASWISASAGLPTYSNPQTVVIDPTAPTTLYAGTYSYGIYKSTNGGTSWNVATNGLNTLNITALVVDPNNSSNVYAGAGGFTYSISLFKSTNGGDSWNRFTSGLPVGAVNLLAANGSTIYTVIGDDIGYTPGSNPNLEISTNGGLNWSSLLEGAALNFTALAFAPPTVPALTIAKSGGSDNVSWPAAFTGYVLQSTPSLNPLNWQNVSQALTTNNGSVTVNVPMAGAQGYYRLHMTNSAATSPTTIYLGTDSASGQGVLKSTDGGTTWYSADLDGDTINALAVNPANPATVYAGLNGGRDGFVCTLLPNGQLYSSTYVGGSGADQGNAIAVDLDDVYVAGSTSSSDFPTKANPDLVQKPAVVADAVKTMSVNIGSNDPTPLDISNNPITKSTEGFDLGTMLLAYLSGALPCPENSVENYSMKAGDEFKYELKLDQDAEVSTAGGLPPGISYGKHKGNSDILIDVTGTLSQSATPGIYTFVVNVQDRLCSWSYTIIITVTQ